MNKKLIKVSNALSLTEFKHIFKVMKLTSLFGVLCVSSAFAINVNSQSLRVNIHANQKQAKEVIKQIEEQTDYLFVYNHDKVNLNNIVTIQANNETVAEVLNQMFAGTDIIYAMQGNNILLMQKDAVVQQSGKVVTGTIVDPSGMPVIGANVMVKGTTNGTITDMDGKFSLEVEEGAILQISYIGYANQEIKVGDQKTLSIALKEDAEALDELVVVGYGTMKRKDFTGSVSSLKLEDSPVSLSSNVNALGVLKGNVAGLDIGASNSAGGQPSMLIRGQNSLSGTNTPLIVVDGVVFLGNLSDINPNDIASFDILKDATSAAAYGSRSANGVITITTKKGKQGKPIIRFNANAGFQNWHLKPQLMDGKQWLDAVSAANGFSDYSFLTQQQKINYDKGQEVRWLDEISRIGWVQDYQISVSGAGNKMNYYLSTAYTRNEGVIKGDQFSRFSTLFKLNSEITDWLNIGFDAAYTRTDNSGVLAKLGTAVALSPYDMLYRPNGEIEKIPSGTRSLNPLWGVEDESITENMNLRDNFRTNVSVLVKCPWITGLNYRLNFSGNLDYTRNGSFTHESYYVPDGPYDDDSRYSASTLNGFLSLANGQLLHARNYSYVVDNILSYDKNFGKHNLGITLVATRDLQKYESQQMKGSDFSANGNTILGLDGLQYATTQKITQDNWKKTNIGYFGRFTYSFFDTYYITASYRRDGSSVFGSSNKWGNFGAFGGAWRISNEKFLRKFEELDDLKLKVSWGRNGNQGLQQYSTLSKVVSGPTGGIYYPFDNSGKPSYGIDLTTIGNVNLGWETTDAWNIGFESSWFDNRILLNIDAYFSRTYDQIFLRTIPVMSGFKTMYSSMGEVKNRGVEISLNSTNIKTKDFTWNTSFTFWLNRNELAHLYGEDLDNDGKEDDDIGNTLFIGESIHSIFGYEQDGIVQVSDTEYMKANGVEAGTPKYVDKNQDGVIDAKDRSIIGNTDPNFKLNMSNTFKYRNWELYFMLAGTFGGNGYFQKSNPYAYITSGSRSAFACNGLYIPYWTEENPSNKYPSARFAGDNYFLGLQSRSYVRLQDITLSYTFRQRRLKKIGINNFKLFVSGKNLFTITKWDGGDPETGGHLFSGTLPVMSNISFGLNLSF